MSETSLGAGDAAPAGLRVGRIFSRAFGIYQRNIATFFMLTAIAISPTLLFLGQSLGAGVQARGAAMAAAGVTGILAILVTFILSIFSQAVVIHGAFQDMRGRPVVLGESLKKGLTRFLPIIGLSFLVGIAVGLSTLLLIIPGIMVYCMLAVALPVCIVEQAGPMESLGRSRELTKGHRWKIFGVLLVLLLASAVGTAIVVAIFSRLGGPAVGAIADFVWRAFLGAFQAIVIVVLYHDLRVVKEGIDIERIAAVFD